MSDPVHAITEALNSAWAQVLTIIGGIIWLVRLEGRVSVSEKELIKMAKQRDTDRAEGVRQRHDDLDAQARSRDETNVLLNEVRADIKSLLRGQGADL